MVNYEGSFNDIRFFNMMSRVPHEFKANCLFNANIFASLLISNEYYIVVHSRKQRISNEDLIK